jgi:guanine deaminase
MHPKDTGSTMNEGRRTRRIFFWMHNCAMGDQCYNQGGGYESPRSFQWIFRGNIVVPTSNPFVFGASSCATTTDSNDEAIAIADTPTVTMKNTPMASADDDDDDDDTSSVVWLGPGLKLLLDHVVAVDEIGIIRHVSPTQSFCSSYKESTPSCSISEFLTTLVPTVQHVVELSSYEFLCPGLIDLHIHAPQYAFTGTATDRPLLGPHGWLETFTFPAERRLATDAALAEHVYQSVVQTTLRHGTTTAVYFATLDLEPCQVLVNAAMQHDQRALIGKVCMDRHAPDTYFQTTEQNITETEALIHYIHDRAGQRPQRSQRSRQVPSATDGETTTTKTRLPLILPLVTPRFIPTCTPQLLSALGGMAARYDCHVTSHISESRDEVAFVQYLDTHVDNSSTTNSNDNVVARSDADIFDAHHLLTDQCIMAHGVYLTEHDSALLRRRGTAIAHCPLSNFFFAGSILPCRQLLQGGNRVGLGTDVAGGYHPSMWHSARMAVVASHALQQQQDQREEPTSPTIGTEPDKKAPATATANQSAQENGSGASNAVLDYRHAFYLATLGGAEALGLQDHIGTLAVGMEFDAIVLSAGNPPDRIGSSLPFSPVQVFATDTVSDVFQKICVLGDDRNIAQVYVQGRKVV